MKILPLAIAVNLVIFSLLHFGFAAVSQGSVMIYSNDDCSTSSNTSIPLTIGKCLGTNQTAAIATVSLPSCPSGEQPLLIISDLENCGRPSFSPPISSGTPGECLYLTSGRGIGSAGFVCIGGTATMLGSSNTPASQTPALNPSTADSGATLTAQLPPVQASLASIGLSQSDMIALGYAISFGVPALILAYMTWRKRSRIIARAYVHGQNSDDHRRLTSYMALYRQVVDFRILQLPAKRGCQRRKVAITIGLIMTYDVSNSDLRAAMILLVWACWESQQFVAAAAKAGPRHSTALRLLIKHSPALQNFPGFQSISIHSQVQKRLRSDA
jgi:hypothetical protein